MVYTIRNPSDMIRNLVTYDPQLVTMHTGRHDTEPLVDMIRNPSDMISNLVITVRHDPDVKGE